MVGCRGLRISSPLPSARRSMCHFLKPRPRRLSSIPSKHPFSTPAHALPSPLLHLPRVILLPKGIWGRGSGPATCHSKASKQARLVETVLYFRCWQLEVGRAVDICPKADPHPPAGGDRSYRPGGGRGAGLCKSSTVVSNSHPQTDHQWSDQRHLVCFRYS